MSNEKYRESHREELRLKARVYRENNLIEIRSKDRLREREKWVNDPEYMRLRKRLYYASNKDELRSANKELYERLKIVTFDGMGGKCCKCGFNDYRALQIDHVNRSDVPHNHPRRSGRGLYHLVRKSGYDKTQFQLLCANCNWIKRFEQGEHNHLDYRPEHPRSAESLGRQVCN